MELKVTIEGNTYTAPPPKLRHFKGYLKLLKVEASDKSGASAIEEEYALIASLFENSNVTPDAIENASFEDGFRLHTDFHKFLSQYIPGTAKNGKAR